MPDLLAVAGLMDGKALKKRHGKRMGNDKNAQGEVRKRNYWTKYGDKACTVLDALLDKYAQTGIEEIEDVEVLTVDPIKGIGPPAEIVNLFGGKPQYLEVIRELEAEIYRVA